MRFVLDDGHEVHFSSRAIGSVNGIAEIDPEAFSFAMKRSEAEFVIGSDRFFEMQFHQCYRWGRSGEMVRVGAPVGEQA